MVASVDERTGETSKAGRVIATLAGTLFLTMLPVTMLVPVLKELVSARYGASAFASHAFMSVNMFGAVLLAPLGAALADRLGRRRPILIAALLINSLLLWLMVQADSLATLFVIRFAEGAAHILAVSTIMALSLDWAESGARGRRMGLVGAALIFGTACGAPLGGRLGQHNPMLVLQMGAGFSLAAAILAIFVLQDAPSRVLSAGIRAAMHLVAERRELLVPYAYGFIDRFCVGVIVSTFVLYLADFHGLSPAQRGGLLALFLFPFALLCYPVGRLADRWGRLMPMCIGSLGFGLVYASYGFLPMGWMPVGMAASGVLSAIMFAPTLALCSDLAPGDQRASAFAGFNVAGSLGFLCGPLVGGAIHAAMLQSVDPLQAYQITFVVAGLTEVACAGLTLPWLRKLRRNGLTS